jgi:UDP-N-acetylglucosamine 2-epimerase (non-hydrolysing)
MTEGSREVAFVAGARPNFMKIAPILREWRARGTALGPGVLVHTGQHYDALMSDVFFRDLGIPEPAFHLEVGSGPHGAQTGRILEEFEKLLLSGKLAPAGVVVVGDVNSTLACTLAAVKLGIPVAHVEAGLRSFDRSMPEEINRLATDALADLLFVTEESGRVNLAREGVAAEKIHLVGNVMIDTLVQQLPLARELRIATRVGVAAGGFALVTLHRPSNVDDERRLAALAGVLANVARSIPLVFPVHPRTRRNLEAFGLWDALGSNERIRLLEPLGYRENLSLMADAALVLTDSGGIQEETTFLGVPCLTLRSNTERPVTAERGTNVLIGEDIRAIERHVAEVLAGRFKKGGPIPLWDGSAAGRIVDVLVSAWPESGRSRAAALGDPQRLPHPAESGR